MQADAESTDSKPIQVIVTRWKSEEFSRGAFSYIPPGASGADYDELAAPVEARLFFAGKFKTT